MLWGAAVLAHAANVGMQHWVITNHPEATMVGLHGK